MAASTILPLILLTLTPVLLITIPQTLAKTPVAPAPALAGPVNLVRILDKSGQYKTFFRLLQQTQVGNQVNNHLKGSITEGFTVFAPTDNAFRNLKAGTINRLTNQQQVQLVLYHVVAKYYSLNGLRSVRNPVRTQATGQNGIFVLTFTSQGNRVNVSSGMVKTQINNALRQKFPLAVYQVDKVLLPKELFGAKSPSEVDKGSPADGKYSTNDVCWIWCK
ncbi:fasciclin-like arabinogalactan protein 9 [Tripterygium wilfordii]|uniref:fasciclin-like arabinogalactan protein 9 n=1 Tax=Tripterygium wilfordii TaxID=458696 RepID=UPI0018F83026|nr:fasciclin-like arabinogalactan protein 9 [Tripterygium wilfordii]